MELEFRKADAANVAVIEACAKQAYSQYVKAIGKKPAPMCADFAALVQRGVVEIAVDVENRNDTPDSGFTGFIVLYPQPDKHSLFVENIAVLPDFSGNGIGTALMSYAEATARENLIPTLSLYTNAKMTRNLGWYVKLGFVETRRIREDGFDRVYFEKSLVLP